MTLAIASGPVVERDRAYHCEVACEGSVITVSVDGEQILSVEDDSYARGQIALRTEAPSRFSAVRVTATAEDAARFERRSRAGAARASARRAPAPAPRLLHEVPIPAGANIVKARDVNDDGRLEFVACEVVVPVLDCIRLAKMTVVNWDGETLWSYGESMPSKFSVHGDFAFNTGDLDGDGRTEIIVTSDFEIIIFDGATGEVKKRCPTPLTYLGQEDFFERTNGDSFLICNLRGLESPQDFVLKDRYRNLWAYTADLKPLWHRHLNMGHYPRARDVNGDCKDEVMAGYSMLKPDGHTLWEVPGGNPERNSYPGVEHVDSVLIERFGPDDAPIQIALAASDFGFVIMDVSGNILVQQKIGHAQNMGCARFRPDLPGRQFVVRTFWGNTDIVHLFDATGNLLLCREIAGCAAYPVNWLGDGGALIRFANCLANANFEPVVDLPKGGSVSPVAYDVNQDGVDELLVREGDTVRIYGPERIPSAPIPQPNPDLTNWNAYGGFYL